MTFLNVTLNILGDIKELLPKGIRKAIIITLFLILGVITIIRIADNITAYKKGPEFHAANAIVEPDPDVDPEYILQEDIRINVVHGKIVGSCSIKRDDFINNVCSNDGLTLGNSLIDLGFVYRNATNAKDAEVIIPKNATVYDVSLAQNYSWRERQGSEVIRCDVIASHNDIYCIKSSNEGEIVSLYYGKIANDADMLPQQ